MPIGLLRSALSRAQQRAKQAGGLAGAFVSLKGLAQEQGQRHALGIGTVVLPANRLDVDVVTLSVAGDGEGRHPARRTSFADPLLRGIDETASQLARLAMKAICGTNRGYNSSVIGSPSARSGRGRPLASLK